MVASCTPTLIDKEGNFGIVAAPMKIAETKNSETILVLIAAPSTGHSHFIPWRHNWAPASFRNGNRLRDYITFLYIAWCYSKSMGSRLTGQPDELSPISPQVFHILIALASGDQHGYAIMQDVLSRTGGKLRLSPGTLYGSMKRMLEQGLVIELRENERPNEDDERRRYYRLTAFGRKVVRAEAERMASLLEQARAYGLAPKRA